MKIAKKLFCICFALSVFIMVQMPLHSSIEREWPKPDDGVGKINEISKTLWATAIPIIQILAVGCVVFTGVKYMLTSADKKADIKKELSHLAIGSILVFATTVVINFIKPIIEKLLTN